MKLSAVHPWNVPFSSSIAIVAMLALAPLFGWAVASEKWIIASAVVMVALTPIFVRWPVVSTFGIYAFLTTSFDTIPLLQGVATLTRPLAVLAIVVLVLAGLMERRLIRPPAAAMWWSLFMLWGILSAAWAINPEVVYNRLLRPLSLLVLYLVAVSFKPTRRELYSVCVLTVLGGVVAAGIAQIFGLGDGGPGGRGRIVIGEMDSNPNSLGRMLLLPIALTLTGLVGLRGALPRALTLAGVGFLGMGIYLSMSRTALVGLITAVSVIAYRIRFRWQIFAACLLLLAVSATMPDRFYQRVTSVVTGEDSTGAGRTEIWKIGLEALDRFWLFGAGLNNYPEVFSLAVIENRGGYGAHSTYIGALIELGAIGLALMFAAIGSQLLAVHNARRAGHRGLVLAAVEATCFGMLAAAAFSDILWSRTFWLMWTLLTWALYVERWSEEIAGEPGGEQAIQLQWERKA